MLTIEQVSDRRGLIIHRFIARRIRKDPMLMERARAAMVYLGTDGGSHHICWDEWDDILRAGLDHVRERLVSRCEDMTRLRNASPFYLVDDPIVRELVESKRVWKLARKALPERIRRDRDGDDDGPPRAGGGGTTVVNFYFISGPSEPGELPRWPWNLRRDGGS